MNSCEAPDPKNQDAPKVQKRTWGGWRPGAGRKNRGVVSRLRLVSSLHSVDAAEQAVLAPLLAAEAAAVAVAEAKLAEWEQARVNAEVQIEIRCTAARKYMERRAAILEQIRRLAPIPSSPEPGR